MLRVTAQKSAAGAKAYFAVSDYLSDKQEITGNWGGKGAELLGLRGEVDKAAFDNLCDNINPSTGKQLTKKTITGRRVGYDLTWSVPKSVSIVHALTGDDRILQAFRASIKDTMAEMEKDMQTRVRKDGAQEDRTTGNLVYSEFIHLTSRPVDGIPCPQLHAHVFTFNATFDPVESQWKAANFGKIKQDAYYWQTVQQSRMVNRLQELGYGVRKTEKDFEIVGVPDSAIKKFSQRTALIERIAAALGIKKAESKAKLGATTREAKNDAIPYSRLVEIWQGKLTDEERNALSDLPKFDIGKAISFNNAHHAEFAVNHSFERASVVDERRLLTLALRHGLGEVTPEGIRAETNRLGLLKREEDGKTWATTRTALQEESRMIAFAVAGKGTMRPLAQNVPTKERDKESTLSTEQQAVIEHLLTSSNRVMIVRGAAGTGKTTLTKEAVARVEASDKHVTVVAPTTAAVDVLKKDGFDANTLARLLVDERMQAGAKDGWIFLDEAGLVGSRSMSRLFELADKLNARIVLMGDKRQLASVERGSPLRVLEEVAKLPVAEVTEIRRQRGEYREAVKLLSQGKSAEGFDKLNAMGSIRLMPDNGRYTVLAKEYIDTLQRGETATIVSPTHAEGEKITHEVRRLLKKKGMIGHDERTFDQYVAIHLTEAERSERSSIPDESFIRFRRQTGDFKAGRNYPRPRSFDPKRCAGDFEVFSRSTIHLVTGDRIRTTSSGNDITGRHRLTNGAQYTVKGFDRHGDIVLDNGWTLSKDFGHFTHAYVSTVFGAQGRTVDRVFAAISATSYPATNREAFYVTTSRGRKSFTLFTDSKDDLRSAVERSNPRMSATELMAKPKPKLLARARAAIGRMQVSALVAAKRAYYEIERKLQAKDLIYGSQR
jgi:conjugative relaxase-like TrwC/TraI family protein